MAPCYLKGITSNTAYKELITLLEEYSTTFTFTFTVGRATPPLGHEPIAATSFGLPKTYLEKWYIKARRANEALPLRRYPPLYARVWGKPTMAPTEQLRSKKPCNMPHCWRLLPQSPRTP